MTEEQFLEQQIAVMQRRLGELRITAQTREFHQPTAFDFVIEFDGGTSCNLPAQGFGKGYGSFQIRSNLLQKTYPIQKVEFGYGHSCNSAEIRTLVAALRDLADKCTDTKTTTILVRGDSRIALKWVWSRKTPTEKSTPLFKEAILLLQQEAAKFKHVKTEWRSREHSVKLFGH
jgi:ribonuclease HI